ncbi:MAG: thermosome subunit alpha [Candidatus Aenigmatarchaeota archaeon]
MPQGAQGVGQPIFILGEDAERQSGKSAQKNNIAAAKAVGDTVRTTLGPKGMDKMLVDSMGDIVVTNDGVTILDEMEIEHPAAKMMVEVAKTQEEQVGDGTTTAVVIGSELLKQAEDLLDQDIHPTVVTRGFNLAANKALKHLDDISEEVDFEKNRDLLKNIAMTSITGKSAEKAYEKYADLAVEAIESIMDKSEGEVNIDKDDVKIEKREGDGISSSELIEGLIIDKEMVHADMPKKLKNAKVALINTAIEVDETETDAEIQISSPDQLENFLDQEEKMLKGMVEKIVDSGADIVFCQKGIDDIAQHYLAKKGIAAVRRVKSDDMERLARATEAKIVNSLDDLSSEDLGEAGNIEEKKEGDKMIYVKDCKSPRTVSLLLTGGTEHVVDEAERSMNDALDCIVTALKSGKIVAGGGSVEQELSNRLKKYAQSESGREQLAIRAFAEALEVIPRTLAENTGLDPVDALVEIRSAHEQGNVNHGLDVEKGKVVNMKKAGVIEPKGIKEQALQSASEAAEMILRIDDVVSAGELSGGDEGGAPGGAPGGMPGGGGMPPGAMGGL